MSSVGVLLTSDFRLPTSAPRSAFPVPRFPPRSAFTLIELLTAMAILVIIVMIALRIFLQSSTVWNVSSTRARINMLGRAAVDYVSQKYAVTNHPADVTENDYDVGPGVKTPTCILEKYQGTNLSVEVHLNLSLGRTNTAVQASSGGPDKDLTKTADNINSWN